MPSPADRAAIAPLAPLRLVGESFRLFFAEFGILFPLGLALALLQEAGLAALQAMAGETRTGLALMSLFGVLSGFAALAVVVLVVRDRLEETARGLDAHVRTVLENIVPLMVVGLAVSLAAGLGLLLFVIPGLYVTARYLVWLPAMLFEGAGFGALGRAEVLTRGHRWPLVGALALLGLLSLGALMLVSPLLAGVAAGAGTLAAAAISAVVSGLDYAVFACFLTLAHQRLASPRDAVGTVNRP
jgi:hypothetical protein